MIKNERKKFNLLDIKDFSEQFKTIKSEIISENNIISDINENDLKIFILIIKNFGLRIINSLKYIIKSNLKYKINKNLSKCFLIHQFSLIFIYLYYKNKTNKITKEEEIIANEKKFKNIYINLFNVIDNIYFSTINKTINENSFLEIDDIFEIIKLNISLGLNDLLNKSYIFNESIHYLIHIFFLNENNQKIQSNLKSIITQIYSNILNSEKNIYFLKRNKNLDNFAILELTNVLSSSKIDNNLTELVIELLNLIYKNNYSNLISDYILDKIKEGFYELKENNSEKIIKCIKNIGGLISFLNNLFNGEEAEKFDPYMPSSYFIFTGNEDSGLIYNPDSELLRKNFTLIFSFKIEEIINNVIYPLISFVNCEGKKEILFNISIRNHQLQLYLQGETKFRDVVGISINQSYLVIIEYKPFSILKDKMRIYVGEQKFGFSIGNIDNKGECSIKIGYLPTDIISINNKIFKETKNFKGKMGSIMQFSTIFEDKTFIPNLMKLKGKYDLILLMNKNANLEHYYKYEEYQTFSEDVINKIKDYFSDYSKKINEDFQYSICPMSLINNNNDTNFFPQNIYNKGTKSTIKDIFPDFNTILTTKSKSLTTYAQKNQKSISVFVQYDGIEMYTLIIEYFYNILRMLIKKPKEEKIELINEIYDVLSFIFIGIFKILKFFNLDNFADSIDTLAFSIKKLFSLIIEVQPLNENIKYVISEYGKQLINYSKKLEFNITKSIITCFLSKLLILIFSRKYIHILNYTKTTQLFEFLNMVINMNNDLINRPLIDKILSFSFILDSKSLDKFYDNPSGTTNSSNKEYKNLKKEYKNLIKNFIENSGKFKLYLYFLQKIFSNQDSSYAEKYKLIKIYYKYHKVQTIYSSLQQKKKMKIHDVSGKELLTEYKNNFLDLLETIEPLEQKYKKYFELLKSLFIMLIYDHEIIIPFNVLQENKKVNKKIKRNSKKSSTMKLENSFMENISFFSLPSVEEKMGKIEEKKEKDEIEKIDNLLFSDFSFEEEENSNQSSDLQDNNKENYLFDELLNSKNLSFYCIKAIFFCLCDGLDKDNKIKYVKTNEENYGTFKDYIGIYDRFKKKLFSQFFYLIEKINDQSILEKSLRLILLFLNKSIDLSNKRSKSLFLHLFENKLMCNNFFIFCLNNEIIKNEEFKKCIIEYINTINNNVLLYHHKPYLFSFIKMLISLENPGTFSIIDNICINILESLKSENKQNPIFKQNLIRFIKTLMKTFDKYSNNLIKLQSHNNFELFYSIQKFLIEMIKNDIIYDPNLYTTNPSLFNHYKEQKKDINYFQSPKTKLLNNQIIFLNIFQLSLNSIYLLWKSQEQNKNVINICLEYISKIHQEILNNDNYTCFYLDLLNPFFRINNKFLAKDIPEHISKIINKDNNINSRNKNNSFLRETKIVNFSLFLIIMKYKSLLINYEKLKNEEKNEEESIIKAFEPLLKISEKDILFLIPNIIKLKGNKNFEIMIEKEESKSKEFKDFNKNIYNYFYQKIKNKSNDIENIKEEIERKFINDENEKMAILENLLRRNYNNELKQEKNRKDSFGEYSVDEIELEDEKNKQKNTKTNIKENKDQKIIDKYKINSLDFEDIKYPILCTKRDIILKNFGYFYYKYYFKNTKFMELKKLFFYKNNPKDEFNNYHDFQNIMKNKYPFIIKNFSNNELYYPRIFYKPYIKFFENKYYSISHSYFDTEKYDKVHNNNILHLEHGHGLLNQNNFDLFNLTNKTDELSYGGSFYSDINKENSRKNSNYNSESLLENFENNLTAFTDGTFIKKKYFQKNKNKINDTMQKKMTINLDELYKLNMLNALKQEETKAPTKFECEKISPKNTCNGFLFFDKYFLLFQSNTKFEIKEYNKNLIYLIASSEYDLVQEEKQIIIPYNTISQILYRKFLFYDVAIEIFLNNGKSYYFNFYNINNKTQFMKVMKEKISEDKIIKKSIDFFEKKKYTNKWLDGVISTLDYLLLINKFSDRSYNVLSHYLILPWLLNNYGNIYKLESLRIFNLPVSFNSKEQLAQIIKEDGIDGYKSHFTNYCTNNMYVNHYLIRTYPYINNQIRLQDNKFDDPERQFDSLIRTFDVFKYNPKINRELVPEFFFTPEFFMNLNCCNYGQILMDGKSLLVNNLGIGPDFKNILEIINYHQLNLNSDNIISQINKWIDFIFGENQISSKDDSVYYFPKECYEKFVKEDIEEECKGIKSFYSSKKKSDIERDYSEQKIISEIKRAKNNIKDILYKSNFYGHCPTQLFTKSHPSFSKNFEEKINNFSNMNNIHISLKNERIKIDKKELLYMQESSNGNHFYIICEHEIIVYNKYFKLSNLSINFIPTIPKIFSVKYHKNDQYFKEMNNCKYLIFDILDCKYFFIGGYLDDSLKIYSKEKDKDIVYSFYFESQIKSIKHSNNNNIFFTGHRNGKIIKWKYQLNNEKNKIDITKEKSIRGHKSAIKMIELNEKYECIITVDENEIIFIRKLYDFELLSFIKFNKYKTKVIDINIYNQIILLTVFKIALNKIFIYIYSLNGLKLRKISEYLKLPITLIPNTDEIIVFRINQIYLSKVALNVKIKLSAITNNLLMPNIDITSEEEKDLAFLFNKDLNQGEAISYFYDFKNNVLFCLFSDGTLYRINLVKIA